MAYGTANVDTIQSSTAGTAPQFNDGNGTQIGTLCRAWVNFNGTGTVAIRASFNVSSITDNGTGDYTVNFTNAMPDANYAWTTSDQFTRGSVSTETVFTTTKNGAASQSTTALRFTCITSVGTTYDCEVASISVFR